MAPGEKNGGNSALQQIVRRSVSPVFFSRHRVILAAFLGATVYSGEDALPIKAAVAVKNSAFAAIERGADSSLCAREVIDGSDLFLIPGLWDMHVHVRLANDGAADMDVA